jgi:hypothetical protein
MACNRNSWACVLALVALSGSADGCRKHSFAKPRPIFHTWKNTEHGSGWVPEVTLDGLGTAMYLDREYNMLFLNVTGDRNMSSTFDDFEADPVVLQSGTRYAVKAVPKSNSLVIVGPDRKTREFALEAAEAQRLYAETEEETSIVTKLQSIASANGDLVEYLMQIIRGSRAISSSSGQDPAGLHAEVHGGVALVG